MCGGLPCVSRVGAFEFEIDVKENHEIHGLEFGQHVIVQLYVINHSYISAYIVVGKGTKHVLVVFEERPVPSTILAPTARFKLFLPLSQLRQVLQSVRTQSPLMHC